MLGKLRHEFFSISSEKLLKLILNMELKWRRRNVFHTLLRFDLLPSTSSSVHIYEASHHKKIRLVFR